MKHVALPRAGFGLLIAAFGCSCAEDAQVTDPPPGLRTGFYRTVTTIDLISDTRVRESAPTQTQGSFGQLKFGAEISGALNLVLMDSSVVFLDSIPTGSEILACTLWVKLNQLSVNDNDSVVLDVWSVTEPWDENGASWQNRTVTDPWSTPGGVGALVAPGHISIKRIDLLSFEWRVGGAVWDTVILESAVAAPIPLPLSLAQDNLDRLSFGFMLRSNSATSPAANFGLVTSEAIANQNRPYFAWVYR